VWDFALSKLYTNALLSTLNARLGWNNLGGGAQNPDNVLFGDTTVASTLAAPHPKISFSPRADKSAKSMGSTTHVGTGSYELNSMKKFGTGEVTVDIQQSIHRDFSGKEDSSNYP